MSGVSVKVTVPAVVSTATPVQGCKSRKLGALRYCATASPAFVARWFPQGLSADALAGATLAKVVPTPIRLKAVLRIPETQAKDLAQGQKAMIDTRNGIAPGRIIRIDPASINGTVKVVETLEARQEKITWCLVGEPSSSKQLGDVIKNGRRGSLNAKLTVHGTQGHVAYPQLADNPIHRALPALTELSQQVWDQGNRFFPATTFQISNIQSGTGATNVIPATAHALFNFRYSTEVTAEQLQARTLEILDRHELRYDIDWTLSGLPFLTAEGELVAAAQTAIRNVTGLDTELSTSGGTSDGRFIAPTGAQVLELGVLNASIHQIDEHVNVADLDPLTDIYTQILEQLLA